MSATDDEARRAMRSAGLSEQRTERLVGFYRLVRDGFCSEIAPDVELVLGREPRRFRDFARANASIWT